MKVFSTNRLFVQGLRVLVLVLAGTLALNGTSAPLAHASVFTVNSFADAVDANPGDGVCLTVGGVCTLRAAIQEANALPGPDVIALGSGTYKLTIPGAFEFGSATGDLNIYSDITINGADSETTIIDGNGTLTGDRVIYVTSGTVTLSHLTIQNGLLSPDSTHPEPTGGGFRSDGGVVTLDSVIVKNNNAHFAGGIYNQATLLLLNSRVINNSATCGNSGGIGNNAGGNMTVQSSKVSGNKVVGGNDGGIGNHGSTLTLLNSTVDGNVVIAGHGGGIGNNNGGTVTLRNSTVESNQAIDQPTCVSPADVGVGGGGIHNNGGTVTLENSTVSNNSAGSVDAASGGGAIRNKSDAGKFATVNIINSTLSGNTSTNAGGGAIRNLAATPDNSVVNLRNATVTNNKVVNANGGGINNKGAGGGSMILKNTLLAGNIDAEGEAPDCFGDPLTSQGYNLLGNNNNCSGLTNGVNGDQVGTNASPINAQLSPLAMHGGTTRTHALLPKSPALDAGNACEPTDQRGVARPQGPRCDIGSYERKTSGDADE